MNEALRMVGINYTLEGALILERLIDDEMQENCLTSYQVKQIMQAWESRAYVPIAKLGEAVRSKPQHLQGETKEQYNRRHISNIVQILKNMK